MFAFFCIVVFVLIIVVSFTGSNTKAKIVQKVKEPIHVVSNIVPNKADTQSTKTEQLQKEYNAIYNQTLKAVKVFKAAVANTDEKLNRLRDSLTWVTDKPTEYDYIAPVSSN